MKTTMLFIIFCGTLSTSAFELRSEVQKYKARYTIDNPFEKLLDNRGEGYEDLYGTRNFRVVLHGVYYRGGANNVNNKYDSRPNMNPLPRIGLQNLCQQGFAQSIYYYTENFDSSLKNLNCKTVDSTENKFEYKQMTATDTQNHTPILKMIFNRIRGNVKGPIYGHCWNGWHASGLIAAITLRQFCNYSGDKAVEYWIKNTDGNSDGFTSIKNKIKNFEPIRELKITPEESALICPGE